MTHDVYGIIHSIQSMGTLDGPGVRFVVFLKGCNLRCHCCHNPDTWEMTAGERISAREIVTRAERYKEYFGTDGGITLSGGEPLLQATFAKEVFRLAKKAGINTCLDTSGSILNDGVKELLSYTDRVLLDVKYTDEQSYVKYVGCSLSSVMEFLSYLNQEGIKTTVRQVIIPTKNDNAQNIQKFKETVGSYPCIDNVELLPFKKICQVKYDSLGIPFPFSDLPTPTREKMAELEQLLK